MRVELPSWTFDLGTWLTVLSKFWVSEVWLWRRFQIILARTGIEVWLWGILFYGAFSRVWLSYVNYRFLKYSLLWLLLKFWLSKFCSWTRWVCDLNVWCWRLCPFVSLNWLWFCRWQLNVCCWALICDWFLEIIWLFLWRVYYRLWFWLWFFLWHWLRVFWNFHKAKT